MSSFVPFKKRYNLDKRRMLCEEMTMNCEDAYPLICERSSASNMPDLRRSRFVVKAQMTVGVFLRLIRSQLPLAEDETIFLFVENTLPQMTTTMGELHLKHADEDGFLYVNYQEESVYG
uniref:Autophagy-related protein n=1 Tax=Steinernema glaseri TaxID=37863 RepID=A0A1I7Y349_9BILA